MSRGGDAAWSAGDRPAGLRCAIEVVRGGFRLEAELAVGAGEIVGIIGPNGAGKSTLLGAIAGTLPLAAGRIELGPRMLSRREPGAPAVDLPRAERRIGHLDQRARLFPHLDAAANIAFGPRAQGLSRRRAAVVAREWLTRVGLADRGAAREGELSGGQQQRVAIARTLAAGPELLLLDEPFAALDVASAQELRRLVAAEIRRLAVPALLVTHDPVDLISLADRVLVLEKGRIAQRGSAAEVLGAPITDFAAEFSGRVLLRGTAGEEVLQIVGAPVERLPGTGDLPSPGRAAVASFDPAAVRVRPVGATGDSGVGYDGGVGGSGRSGGSGTGVVWEGTVAALSASRTGVRIGFEEWSGFAAEVPVSRALDPALAPGSRLRVELAAADVRFAAPAS